MLARLIVLVLLASCASGFVVKVDSDEAFTASKYKDFKIFKPDPFRVESDEEENPIRINRIERALSSSLVKLGLVCEITQNALVTFPSEIVGNHRSKQD